MTWWLNHIGDHLPIFHPPHTLFLATDASDEGYGATINGQPFHGLWSGRQMKWSINKRELFVVKIVLQRHAAAWKGQALLLQSDNQTVVSSLNHQGTTKSLSILLLAGEILQMLHEAEIFLSAYHLPGRYNLAPDALSRPSKQLPEWYLRPACVQSFWHLLGRPTIDMFASQRSRQTYRYWTFNASDQKATAIDAFSQVWTREIGWCFPPPTEIPRTLAHLRRDGGSHYLVTPVWEHAWWFGAVQRLASKPPFTIPLLSDNLIDLATGKAPERVNDLNLAVWTICSVPASTEA
jgi:hypothetical protein